MYDYIGYGLSRGSPTEEGCYRSMEAVMRYVTYELGIKTDNIYLIGESLGTGVVVDYMYKNQWTGPTILVSPYKSIARVVLDSSLTYPFDKFMSLDKIKNIKAPIKIIHGTADNVINISHAVKLYDNLINKKFKPLWITDAGHGIFHLFSNPSVMEHYREVLNE